MRNRSRHLPYPELVEERPGARPYEIRDSCDETWLPSTGVVDIKQRKLWVPLRPDGRSVSRHELAHVRWSPPRLPEVPYPSAVLRAVEDARINLGLEALGLAVRLDAEQRAQVVLLGLRELKAGRMADFTLRWVASLGTDAEAGLGEAAAGSGPRAAAAAGFAGELALRVRARLEPPPGKDVAPFPAARRAADELASALRIRGALDPAFREIRVQLPCSLAAPDGGGAGRRRPGRGPAGTSPTGAPGPMRVVEAPLGSHRRRDGAGPRRGWRASVEGARIGSFHRWAVDRAVFQRRTGRGGGAVLVDTSGSMRLAPDDVDAILEASRGAALVAIYSGRDDRGELRVVARGGRRAAREYLEPYGGGNIVDLPALEWLARQPRPRIWVSDGRVTGVGDRPTEALLDACRTVQRQAAIQRVGSAAEAAKALTSRWRSG